MKIKYETKSDKGIGPLGCLGLILLGFLIYSFLGFLLSLVWNYGVVAFWATAPVVTWWQCALVAFGIGLLKG